MTTLKKQNKEIKKRELAKIRRMPAGVRAKMRKQLTAKLKERSDNMKKRLPSKVMNPGHLRQLLQKRRTLTV